jgi:hypothetical protein
MFCIIFFFDRKKGPKVLPINDPKFEEIFSPNILNIANKIIINKNSKKYLIIFIFYLLKN